MATIQNDTPDAAAKEPRSRIFSSVDTSAMAQNAVDFIQKAVDVLEQEIAVGILAAQKVEKRFIDVEKIREQDPNAALSRFREHAHAMINIAIDIISVTTQRLEDIAQKVVGPTDEMTDKKATSQVANNSLPILQPDASVPPGGKFSIPVTLENDHGTQEMVIHFAATSLTDQQTGNRIEASQMKFEPAELRLAPKTRGQVTLHVNIPKTTKSGSYMGMIQDKNLPALRAIVLTEVGQTLQNT